MHQGHVAEVHLVLQQAAPTQGHQGERSKIEPVEGREVTRSCSTAGCQLRHHGQACHRCAGEGMPVCCWVPARGPPWRCTRGRRTACCGAWRRRRRRGCAWRQARCPGHLGRAWGWPASIGEPQHRFSCLAQVGTWGSSYCSQQASLGPAWGAAETNHWQLGCELACRRERRATEAQLTGWHCCKPTGRDVARARMPQREATGRAACSRAQPHGERCDARGRTLRRFRGLEKMSSYCASYDMPAHSGTMMSRAAEPSLGTSLSTGASAAAALHRGHGHAGEERTPGRARSGTGHRSGWRQKPNRQQTAQLPITKNLHKYLGLDLQSASWRVSRS